MEAKRLSSFRSVVVNTLITTCIALFPGLISLAADSTAAPSFSFNAPATACADIAKSIVTATDAMAVACNSKNNNMSLSKKDIKSCQDTLEQCKSQERAAGQASLEDGDTHEDDCKSLAKLGCEDANGTDEENRKDKAAASKTRHELEKEKDDNAKAGTDQVQQAQDKSNQINDQLAKDDQEWQQNRIKAGRELQDALSKMDDDRAKAVKDGQQAFDKISANYIELRDDLRRKTSKASNMELSWNVQCRAAANSAGKDAEKQMDDRMAAEDKQLINYRLSTSAGMKMRRLKKKRQKILDAYNTMLSRCLQGADGPGVEIKQKLDEAKKDVVDSTAKANDQAALMENQRKETLSDMQALEASLDKKTAQLTMNTAQDIQMLDQNHATNQQRLSQQAMQAQMQAGAQTQAGAKQAKSLDKDLSDARDDEAVASSRLKCGAHISADEAKEARSSRRTAAVALKTLEGKCSSFSSSCRNDPAWVSFQVCSNTNAAATKQSAADAAALNAKGNPGAGTPAGGAVTPVGTSGTYAPGPNGTIIYTPNKPQPQSQTPDGGLR